MRQLAALSRHTDLVVLDVPCREAEPRGENLANTPLLSFWQHADDLLLVTSGDDSAVMNSYALLKSCWSGTVVLPRLHVAVNHARDQAEATDVHSRLDRSSRRFLQLPLALAGSLPTSPTAAARRMVSAQVSGTVKLVSDYRFRGISLSQDKPAAQATVLYDDSSGWYAGAFASTVRFARSSGDLQALPFVGYASRLPSGVSWEAGADYSAFAGIRQRNVALSCIGCEKFDGKLRVRWGERTRASWVSLPSGSSWSEDFSSGPMRKPAWQLPAADSSASRPWDSSRGRWLTAS